MFFRRFNFSIWRTKPGHLFDFILWWIIKLVWEPFSLKRSHWWHWVIKPLPKGSAPLVVWGDNNEKSRNTKWRNLFLSNFGWQRVAVLGSYTVEPIGFVSDGHEAASINVEPVLYQVGWNQPNNPKFKDNEFELCVIAHKGVVGLLVGPGTTNFFAQTLEGEPLPLVLLGYETKRGALRRGVQIF